MEGFEKVKLIRPDSSHRGRQGEIVPSLVKAEYPDVWVIRRDKSGRERDYGNTITTDFNTIFELREMDAWKDINEGWEIRDLYGDEYDIQAVSRERRYNGRYRILLLYAKRRQ